MFTLAHISDWHLASRPRFAELFSKRGLGRINWHRRRKSIHRPEVFETTVQSLKAARPDHIAVTGDLVNLSLADEYNRARGWLQTLGPPADVSLVPGNHDVYVKRVVPSPDAHWGEYMRGDDDRNGFPFLRRRGNVALIGLSTAVPTAPLMATGRLGKPQLARLLELLDQTRGMFRVVLIHHPVITPPERRLRRLVDAPDLSDVLADKGAELLLHGHNHQRALVWLNGPKSKVPAVGVPSASATSQHGEENSAGYNLFLIDGEAGNWRCEMIGRERDSNGSFQDAERRTLY